MGIKRKILIIGFEKEPISYPHMKHVVDFFLKSHDADYYYLSERGYFLGVDQKKSIKNTFKLLIKMIIIVKAALLLLNKRNKYSEVIAVDNLSYIISSSIFKKTTLWSHDFVTNDQEHSKSYIQRYISSQTKLSLEKERSLIIQDNDRLNLFLTTYDIKQKINVFYLPVSLPRIDVNSETPQDKGKLALMQIGGINKFRSGSHRLIQYYQDNFHHVDLILHGFFDDEIKKLLIQSKKIPICSTLPLEASDVYKLVESADVGFISYETENLNFYYISNASGQLVEFLRLHKPVISFGNTNLNDFISMHGLGISIEKIEDLSTAIDEIKNNYHYYSTNCKNYYNENFDLNLYLGKMSTWMIYE